MRSEESFLWSMIKSCVTMWPGPCIGMATDTHTNINITSLLQKRKIGTKSNSDF